MAKTVELGPSLPVQFHPALFLCNFAFPSAGEPDMFPRKQSAWTDPMAVSGTMCQEWREMPHASAHLDDKRGLTESRKLSP